MSASLLIKALLEFLEAALTGVGELLALVG
jgi:hypothetical protein